MDNNDLVKRLHAWVATEMDDYPTWIRDADDLMREAATELTALLERCEKAEASVKSINGFAQKYKRHMQAAEERAERAEAALSHAQAPAQPFDKEAFLMSDDILPSRVAALAALAAPDAAPVQEPSPENRFEEFVQAAIDSSPEPLKRLGEYLANVLNDDQFPTAERMLLGAAVASSSRENVVRETIDRVLAAEQDFREQMGLYWESDPLSDAIDALRALISEPKP